MMMIDWLFVIASGVAVAFVGLFALFVAVTVYLPLREGNGR